MAGHFHQDDFQVAAAGKANNNATSPGDLDTAADAIWAQYGGKFPAAAEATMAAATADRSQWGRSLSPHRFNNKSRNRGQSHHRQDGGKGDTGSRYQMPGRKPLRRQSWCFIHSKFGAAAINC